MTGERPEKTFWRDLPAATTPEAYAGDLLRRIGEPDLPGDDRMAAIRARITLRRGTRIVRRSFTWVPVVAALTIGTTLGVAAHGLIAPLKARLHLERAEAPAEVAPAPTRQRARGRAAIAANQPSEVAEDPPAGAEPAAVTPSPAVAIPRTPAVSTRSHAPGPFSATAPAPRGESALLATALRKLRREADARGALAALDEYAAAFPGGELAAEADLVRVEALLAVGEREAALRLLDDCADANPRARQALLVRGELRAAAGRCADAIRDLDRVLAQPPRDGLDERALFARASCSSRLHDYVAARRDLDTYLGHFSDAPRAAQAAQIRGALPDAR